MGSGAQGFRGRGRGGGARRVREVALSRTCACSGSREPRSGHLPKVTQPEAKVFPAPSPTAVAGAVPRALRGSRRRAVKARVLPVLPSSLCPALLLPPQPLALSKCSEKAEGLSVKTMSTRNFCSLCLDSSLDQELTTSPPLQFHLWSLARMCVRARVCWGHEGKILESLQDGPCSENFESLPEGGVPRGDEVSPEGLPLRPSPPSSHSLSLLLSSSLSVSGPPCCSESRGYRRSFSAPKENYQPPQQHNN